MYMYSVPWKAALHKLEKQTFKIGGERFLPPFPNHEAGKTRPQVSGAQEGIIEIIYREEK